MQGIKFIIWGKPIAQARPKFRILIKKNGKSIAYAYNPQETEAGKFAVAVANQLPAGFIPFDCALNLSARFIIPMPKSVSKIKRELMINGDILPAKKPDLDNYVKFVKDCFNGIVWIDDSQVVKYCEPFEKIYGEMPRTEITVFCV